MDLEKFKSWMLGESYSMETIKGYVRYLKQIESDVEIDELDEYFEIAKYLHEAEYSRHQKNNIAKAVNAYLKMEGVDYRLKLDKRSGPRDIWIPSDEQKEQLLEVSPWKNRYYNERNNLMLRILFEGGLRAEEVVNLRFSDLKRKKDEDRYYIHVKMGKGGKDRIVPVSEELYNEIKKFEKYYSSSKWIFDNGNNEPLSSKTVRQICYQAAEATEEEDLNENFHPHACRHYRAVELLDQDVNLEAIRRFLGHSSLETTKQYLSGSDNLIFKEFEKKDKHISGGV